MSLQGSWAELNSALKAVRQRWDDTGEHWRDSVRQDFEEQLWKPLEAQTVAVLRAMEHLGPVLDRAVREAS